MDLPGMSDAVGRGLDRAASGIWIPRGKFLVPQPCPIRTCTAGDYTSVGSLRKHLVRAHPGMGDRERAIACDLARRSASLSASIASRRHA